MKVLVFSDSHSNPKKIEKALEIHGGVCDFAVFLGDGIKDIDYVKLKYPSVAFFCVKGNCDSFLTSTYANDSVLDIDGIRVFITHGNMYGVKGGYERIANAAADRGASAVFFGHTHMEIDDIYELENGKRIHLFNPGSIAYGNTYGVVNTSGGALVCSIGKI